MREVFDGLRRTLALLAADSDLAEVWARGHNSPDELSDVDRVRFGSLLADYVLMYREAQVAHREGMLSDEDHDRLRAYVGTLLNSEGGTRAWSVIERTTSEDLSGALNEVRGVVPAYRAGAEFPKISSGDEGWAP